MTSEVVTNAIVHAAAAPSLVVRVTRVAVRVEVFDPVASEPVVRHPSPWSADGRGMEIVDRLAREWGVERAPGGKRVWFEVPFSSPPLPDWVRSQNNAAAPAPDHH